MYVMTNTNTDTNESIVVAVSNDRSKLNDHLIRLMQEESASYVGNTAKSLEYSDYVYILRPDSNTAYRIDVEWLEPL